MKPPRYTEDQLQWHREIAHAVSMDARAMKLGVACIRVEYSDWHAMGRPLGLRIDDVVVPIDPDGKKPGRYTWRYKKPGSGGPIAPIR